MPKAEPRECDFGHSYVKSSECPVCPICEREGKPTDGFLALLSAPARRALVHAEITTLPGLSTFRERDILKLHGMGPASLPILRKALQETGLQFRS